MAAVTFEVGVCFLGLVKKIILKNKTGWLMQKSAAIIWLHVQRHPVDAPEYADC